MKWLFPLVLMACASTLPTYDMVAGATVCEAACDRRQALGCLEAALVATCPVTCERAAAADFYSPECVIGATAKEELAKCRVRCQ